MDLLIRNASGAWDEPTNRAYLNEAELQELLAAHPHLVPGVSQAAKSCREFQSEVGPADIVIVEHDGSITLVECKLAKNPEVRREIIGQLFDYAGRLWQMDADRFDERWRARNGQSVFAGPGFDDPALRETVSANLAAGRFRLVLAVDAINPALKRMVEYLNGITSSETAVIAVEYLRYFQGELELLAPRTYGQDIAEAKSAKRTSASHVWSATEYRDWLREHEPASVVLFDLLLEGIGPLGFTFIGGRGNTPSGVFAGDDFDGHPARPLQLATDGRALLELNFAQWVVSRESAGGTPEPVDDLMRAWGLIPEFARAMEVILSGVGARRRSVMLASLTPEAVERLASGLTAFSRR